MPTDYDTYIQPVQGNSLQLTVDVNVQHYLENYLSTAVKEHSVTARGVGIVMEVDTGRILAIATKPDYDPNEPRVIQDETVRARWMPLPARSEPRPSPWLSRPSGETRR